MAVKVFLDVNILIDFLDESRSNHADAVKLIIEAEEGSIYCFVTESVLNTTAHLIRKDYTSKEIIQLFIHFLSFVQMVPIDGTIYLSGLNRAVNDMEDAILYSAALYKKVDYFITNNIKDFKKLETGHLPVLKAKEFLMNI